MRRYFNPPTPWGVGRFRGRLYPVGCRFQSTHPVGGGTRGRAMISALPAPFQSTHPVGGGTLISPPAFFHIFDFNPPTP